MNLNNEEARALFSGVTKRLDADRYEVRDGIARDLWTGAEYEVRVDPATGRAAVVNRASGAVFADVTEWTTGADGLPGEAQ